MILKRTVRTGLLFVVIFCARAAAQITFSEVMFDVATSEYHDEFVEIFNLSETDSADAAGYYFNDGTGTDEIIHHSGPGKIAPRSFALLLDGSYFANSTVYDSIIATGIPVFTITDNALGSGGLSNTVAEYLSITTGDGDTLTTYRYSPGNLPGYSDEKIDLDGDNTSDNWQDSRILNGTPGRKNSVSPADVDIGFAPDCWQMPMLLFSGDTVEITLTVASYGLRPPEGSAVIRLFIPGNDNNFYDEQDVLIGQREYTGLYPANISFQWIIPDAGEYRLMATVNNQDDGNGENNHSETVVTVLPRESTLHINEIKFITLAGEPEWVELYNSGEKTVSLKGWAITDQIDTAWIDTPVVAGAGEYMVISAGSLNGFYTLPDSQVIVRKGFPTLNNDQDNLALLSPGGGWEEIVRYRRDWLEPLESEAVSLERINPAMYSNDGDNWGPCAADEGATPGRKNSLYISVKQVKETIQIHPNPFSPDNDGFDDVTVISGSIPVTSTRIRVRIFDIKGRLIRTVTKDRYSGSSFDLVWDGRDDQGRTARIGIYIVFIEALDTARKVVREFKTTVVLAHRLN